MEPPNPVWRFPACRLVRRRQSSNAYQSLDHLLDRTHPNSQPHPTPEAPLTLHATRHACLAQRTPPRRCRRSSQRHGATIHRLTPRHPDAPTGQVWTQTLTDRATARLLGCTSVCISPCLVEPGIETPGPSGAPCLLSCFSQSRSLTRHYSLTHSHSLTSACPDPQQHSLPCPPRPHPHQTQHQTS